VRPEAIESDEATAPVASRCSSRKAFYFAAKCNLDAYSHDAPRQASNETITTSFRSAKNARFSHEVRAAADTGISQSKLLQ